MALTTIKVNEWVLNHEGKLIPLIHFDPVRVEGNLIGQLPCYNYWWIVERGLGVGATIFIETRPPGRTGYVNYNNDPRVPNVPQYCECGTLFTVVGRHLVCLQSEDECYRRGVHAWLIEEPLDWFCASLSYPSEVWTSIRDVPNYFRPREVK
jgi:hypothetical protein